MRLGGGGSPLNSRNFVYRRTSQLTGAAAIKENDVLTFAKLRRARQRSHRVDDQIRAEPIHGKEFVERNEPQSAPSKK
jgi:hypothetical protein